MWGHVEYNEMNEIWQWKLYQHSSGHLFNMNIVQEYTKKWKKTAIAAAIAPQQQQRQCSTETNRPSGVCTLTADVMVVAVHRNVDRWYNNPV